MNIDINHYLDDWARFHIDCALRAKGRAHINSTGWRRLRQYHFEQYIQKMQIPFAFMFGLRYKYPHVYKQIGCASKIYHECLSKRNEQFERRYDGAGHGQRNI